jgi:uncharacterized membrane protein
MLEFIGFVILFFLVFRLQKDVDLLKRELFFLKRSLEVPQTNPAEISLQTPYLQSSEGEVKTAVANEASPFEARQNEDAPLESPVLEQPSKEHPPSVAQKLAWKIKNYFTSGNVIVRIGGVVLFFGLAFLAKYAAEHSAIGIEVRLGAIALAAAALTGIGWRLREREGYYGIILQGLGIGVFYLVIFAAAKEYLLFSLGFAFVLMLGTVVAGSLLALRQDALALALFSLGGGFITPILTSDGSGSHIALFSYYALLNLGVVIMAWHRSWRVLNITGFFFTFVIAVAWGVLEYEREHLLSCEFFLILFYLLYLCISILFSLKEHFSPRGMVDATLVFGLPIIAFGLQVSLVDHIAYASALSAFVLGSLYAGLFFVLRKEERLLLLARSFLFLSVLFYTVMIPYLFDTRLSATLWAIEGASLIYIALRQEQLLVRYAGQLLVLLATVAYVLPSRSYEQEAFAFFNTGYLGYLFLIGANLFSAYMLDKNKIKVESFDKNNYILFLFIGMMLWLLSGLGEAQHIGERLGNTMLLYLAFWGALFGAAALYLRWRNLKLLLQGYFLLGIFLLVGLLEHYMNTHPFEGIGSVALVAFFAVHYRLLYLFELKWKVQPYWHLFGFWAMVLLLACEAAYGISLVLSYPSWEFVAWMGTVVFFAALLFSKKNLLPSYFAKYEALYKSAGLSGLAVVLFVSILYGCNLEGAYELAYVPLINPTDGMSIAAFYVLSKWLQKQDIGEKKPFVAVLAGVLLLFASVVLARGVHAYAGVAYDLFSLLESGVFQMGISILWSFVALGVIALAKKMQNRLVWAAGASLIGIVVVKLFLVELAKSGSIERIVSFIVVGVLLLLIGYFAPLPPKEKGESV